MRSLINVALILLLSSVSLSAQQPKGVRKQKNLPGLYITFEKVGELPVEEIVGDKERVWLRLHNNTRWPIRLDMNGVPPEYGDAGLFIDGLLNGEVIFRERCHACSTNYVHPGKSILFNVARSDLRQGYAIRVKFSYGWEQWDDVTAGREPEHYVYFDASQIPPQFQQAASLQGSSDPKVQIDYICEGARESAFSDESKQGIWLKLRNNSRRTLFVPIYPKPKTRDSCVHEAKREVGIEYEVVEKKSYAAAEREIRELPAVRPVGGIPVVIKVKPGKSIIFSVAREHLVTNRAIYITFRYGQTRSRQKIEELSRAYFYAFELPDRTAGIVTRRKK